MLSEDFCGGALSDKGSVFATVGIRIRLIIYSWKGGGSGKEEKSRCRGEEGGRGYSRTGGDARSSCSSSKRTKTDSIP